MQNPNAITMIMEETVMVSSADLQILKESKNEHNGVDKVTFKVPLQDADKVNGNRRLYSHETCSKIVEGLTPMAKNRCLFQEIDHPMINSNDQDTIKKRAIVVELKNCGSLVSDIYMEGNNVYGIIETLSGFRGPDLRDLIVKDKANIGFSLRMFSRIEPHSTMEGVMEVKMPLRPITYDIVTNPSHKNARMVQFTTESEQLKSLMHQDDESLVTEAQANEILLCDNIRYPNTSKEMIAQYLNELVREAYDDLRNITFKVGN
ncbi:MAG: hypothetical protein H8D97_01680 [Proteobacteria bacterium]|nr:hypothetical protein [Pseudomonadota bacterium]